MPTTSFTLSDELLEKVRERAENEDKQQSEVIRTAIREYLNDDLPELRGHEERIAELEEEVKTLKTAMLRINEARTSAYDPYGSGGPVNLPDDFDDADR